VALALLIKGVKENDPMKWIISFAVVAFSSVAFGKSDISFNHLINKANVKRQQLQQDVNALIEKEDVGSDNSEVIDFIAEEVQALDAKSKLVDSERAASDEL
tara:strand:- start:35329 stop:35634 length:306 start_codon:yes stop_codon:yes gene_type:complete